MLERISNPKSINREEIHAKINDGTHIVIQFSEPDYSPSVLENINYLCRNHGNKINVRFFGHEGMVFNASTLSLLPNVESLSIETKLIANHDEIGKLSKLKHLLFSVFNFEQVDFLSTLNASSIQNISIGPSLKKNIHLAHLTEFKKLEELSVAGHVKNIETTSNLPNLKYLALTSIGKRQNLTFVNSIGNLESLKLFLGGRESFAEVINPNLNYIDISRVKGLKTLGDLSRFPKLTRFKLTDQLRIESIIFSKSISDLREIRIASCKGLSRLDGIKLLENLNAIRISTTKIEFDSFLSDGFPESVRTVVFQTGRVSKDKEIRALLKSRGLKS